MSETIQKFGEATDRLTKARDALYTAAEHGDPVAQEYILAYREWILSRKAVFNQEVLDDVTFVTRTQSLAVVDEILRLGER